MVKVIQTVFCWFFIFGGDVKYQNCFCIFTSICSYYCLLPKLQ